MNYKPKSPVVMALSLFLAIALTIGALRLSYAQWLSPTLTDGEGPWTNFSADDGLAAQQVLSLAQRPDGALLAGTTNGLNVLLPSGDWLTFGAADGLGGLAVARITLDPVHPQRAWIATENGVTLFDDGGDLSNRAVHTWINFEQADGMAGSSVVDILIAQDGRIWLAHDFYDVSLGEIGAGVSVLDYGNTPFEKNDDGWTTYTTAVSDLASNAVRSIAQGQNGVIWIATKLGLNALSNGVWTTYRAVDGLPINDVVDVLPVGNLVWASTPNGLAVIDTAGTPHDKSDDTTAVYNYFNSGLYFSSTGPLARDSEGNLWISLFLADYQDGYGVNVFDTGGTPFDASDDRWQYFSSYDDLSSGAVFDMVVPTVSGESVAWFATDWGLNRLDFGASPFASEDDAWSVYSSANRPPGVTVSSIANAGFGAVYVGSNADLSLFDYRTTPHNKGDDRWRSLIDLFYYANINWGVARALQPAPPGRLWVGMTTGLAGLTGLDTMQDEWDDYFVFYDSTSGLADDRINDIEIDNEGRLWIAAGNLTRGGLQMLDTGDYLTSRNDDIWATFAQHNSPAMPANAVSDIALDADGNLWLATSKGAARLDFNDTPDVKQDDQWTTFTPDNSELAYESVRRVAIDDQGNVWFGLNIGGVSVVTPQGAWATFTQADGLSYDSITSLAFDDQGRLWIGTDGGGLSVLDAGDTPLDKGDDAWMTYDMDNALLSDNIRAIHFDELGQAWVGAFGGGLTVYSDFVYGRSYLPMAYGPDYTPTPTPTPLGTTIIVLVTPIPVIPLPLTPTPTWTPTPNP